MKNVKTAYHYNLRGNKYMQEHKEPAHDKLDRTDDSATSCDRFAARA